MKKLFILILWACITIYNTSATSPKAKPMTFNSIEGTQKGVWVADPCGEDGFCCAAWQSGSCVVVVVTPKAAFMSFPATELIHALYGLNGQDAVEKVELFLGEKSANTYVGNISAYTFSTSECSGNTKINYTLGQWIGPYFGPIDLNTVVEQLNKHRT